MATFHVMGLSGHTELEYDRTNPVEVEEMRKEFDRLISKEKSWGYVKNADGSFEGPLREFDPTAEEVFVHYQMQAG